MQRMIDPTAQLGSKNQSCRCLSEIFGSHSSYLGLEQKSTSSIVMNRQIFNVVSEDYIKIATHN